jgi:hypothetical protein
VKNKRWQFYEAWQELKRQWKETRKTATEGMQAMKLEASLYSGVIGKLGFPLAQYAVDNLSPKLGAFLAKENLLNALSSVRNKKIRRITLKSFEFGNKGPTLLSARTYDLKEESAMAIDLDIQWDSELVATINVVPKLLGINKYFSVVTVPVTLKNCRFEGVVRVILTPLTDTPPGFGAALISFPKAPSIGLDCTVSSVEVTTTFPWLKAELLKEIQKTVANEFLWPKRIIVPSGIVPEQPPKPVLTRSQLEELRMTDPLLKAEARVDRNEFAQRYELTREIADADDVVDNMDVFVGDESERIRLLNITSALASEKAQPRFWWGGVEGFRFDPPWHKRH